MSYVCKHSNIRGRCPECDPPRLNLDRFGMPLDYTTYMWLLYKEIVVDESPARLAFLGLDEEGWTHPNFGLQFIMR